MGFCLLWYQRWNSGPPTLDYKAIGKIGEGTFSEVMKMQSLRDGNYYACKQMKQHFESLQPLFPGVNELDQISKIHDVIGTPCQKTLTKFKQSRAMSFDFPFKKGSGIPLLTTNLSPQCLSLLHAMVAYDPDERIAAHQALQHPYFQVQRAAETQTLAKHRRAFFPKYPMVPESSRNNWSFSKEGRKQQPPRQEEGHARRQGPASLMELPKLRLSGVTRLSSCSSPALRSVLGPGANGRVPVLRPLKCAGVNKKTDTQKAIKPHLKQCHLPTINRKGGEY
ncbi:MAPK/MAK/MRK overlapping kinase isoform X10 [Peromyscus eremicus]|uniref:MAPK/MAK/MRK overlapping kinase isoform X10 n=1 Tax=Peromyscus eremicus TaxID=42410 RepID=UPI0027DB433F|nr:MAPK/MAK/MRK overlapping kinase isoform X10 [Peromyscus eremicus]